MEENMSKPSHIAHTARTYKDVDGIEKKRWHEIGAAWPTKSGNGFNVTLFALPVDGQISLFVPSEKPGKTDQPQE
jgi:hypothetical protein